MDKVSKTKLEGHVYNGERTVTESFDILLNDKMYTVTRKERILPGWMTVAGNYDTAHMLSYDIKVHLTDGEEKAIIKAIEKFEMDERVKDLAHDAKIKLSDQQKELLAKNLKKHDEMMDNATKN